MATPMFTAQSQELFSKVFGRAPQSPDEQSFLRSAQGRKSGPALFGAIQSFQKGQGGSPQAAPAEGQPQGQGMDVGSAISTVMQKLVQQQGMIQGLLANRPDLQEQQEAREALMRPAVGSLLSRRGELAGQLQPSFSTALESVKSVDGVKPLNALSFAEGQQGNVAQQLADIQGEIALRGGTVSEMLQNLLQYQDQEIQGAQAQAQSGGQLLQSLIQGAQAQREAEEAPLRMDLLRSQISASNRSNRGSSGSGAGSRISSLLGGSPSGDQQSSLSFDEFIKQKEQERRQTLTPEAREDLRPEYESMVKEQENNNPQAILSTFTQKSIANDLPKFAFEAGQEEILGRLQVGDYEGARAIIDSTGRGLPATNVERLAEIQRVPQFLSDLRSSIQRYESKFGPIQGTVNSLNKFDVDSQTIQSQINLVRQTVGRALEGGVLRKEDEEKYKKILSTLNDLGPTALNKIDILDRTIKTDYNSRLDQFSRGGYNVSDFRSFDVPGNISSSGNGSSDIPSVGSVFQGGRVVNVRQIK